MSDNKIGKWFEKKLQTTFASLQRSNGMFYHRIKDSGSAGRVVGNAPADYLVSLRSPAILIEAKASTIHPSLRSCLSDMVDDGQVGAHGLWHRNGQRSYFIFYSDQLGEVEVWDGRLVVEARSKGTPLPKGCQEDRFLLKEMESRLPKLLEMTE